MTTKKLIVKHIDANILISGFIPDSRDEKDFEPYSKGFFSKYLTERKTPN
jgi:hypothetical protein